jgi:hypothetical protein
MFIIRLPENHWIFYLNIVSMKYNRVFIANTSPATMMLTAFISIIGLKNIIPNRPKPLRHALINGAVTLQVSISLILITSAKYTLIRCGGIILLAT